MTFPSFCVYHEHDARIHVAAMEPAMQRRRIVRERRADVARAYAIVLRTVAISHRQPNLSELDGDFE